MKTIDPKAVPVATFHNLLLGAVTPRPIALASTVDKNGNINLSPFSFFNCFGANPPILIFSPSRRVRNNTTKHTYENILEVPEVVIHILSYKLVQQASLSSTEYAKGVNEFDKAGFTAVPSFRVQPPRALECPVAFECRVQQVIETGSEGGAGNLVICEVLLMHIDESILKEGKIDPFKLDSVSRLGGDWYARINEDNIFTVPKPLERLGIGIDQLPLPIKTSKVLTGNDLAKLANVEAIPAVMPLSAELQRRYTDCLQTSEGGIHELARQLLEENRVSEAWNVLQQFSKNDSLA